MANQLTNPLGGRGTTGIVAKWSSPTTIGDSILTDSGTAISSSGPIRATGTNATAPAFTGSDTDTGVYFPAANQVRVATAGTLAIAVDASQNVGIGTASPAAILHVTTGTVPNLAALYVGFGGSTNYYDANTHIFRDGGASERARINSAGNVGIGTASPADRLTISGGGFAITGNISGATTAATSLLMDNAGGTSRLFSIGASASAFGNFAFIASKSGSSPGAVTACIIDRAAGVLLGTTATAVFNASASGQGIKLPATPGNADVQTLDAYNQNAAWTPTVTFGTGGTVTTTSVTGAFTQIGNVVTFTVTVGYNSAVIPTGGEVIMDLPRPAATGLNQRPGTWAFNAFNGPAGTNFLNIGSGATTATLRVATTAGTADIAVNLTVTAAGAFVVTATYLAS